MTLRDRPLAVVHLLTKRTPRNSQKVSVQMQRNFSFSERQTVVQLKSWLNRHREKLR
jgi:hypothetical protein